MKALRRLIVPFVLLLAIFDVTADELTPAQNENAADTIAEAPDDTMPNDWEGPMPWPEVHSVVDIGARLRFSWDFVPDSFSAPLVAGSLFANERFSLSLDAILDWGLGGPDAPGLAYFDLLGGMSAIFFPFRDILSFRVSYYLSSGLAILNNYGHIMDAELTLDIPVGRGYFVSLSGGVFWRACFPVIGYWGSEAFYGSRAGWTFQAAVRWRGMLMHYPLP